MEKAVKIDSSGIYAFYNFAILSGVNLNFYETVVYLKKLKLNSEVEEK